MLLGTDKKKHLTTTTTNIMRNSKRFLLALLLLVGIESASATNEYIFSGVGDGQCQGDGNKYPDFIGYVATSSEDCQEKCKQCPGNAQIEIDGKELILIGAEYGSTVGGYCGCLVQDGAQFNLTTIQSFDDCSGATDAYSDNEGSGELTANGWSGWVCSKAELVTTTSTTSAATTSAATSSSTIPSWDIVFDSIEANFSKGSDSEVVLEYNISKHEYRVTLYPTGCNGNEDEITSTDAINVTTSELDVNSTHEKLLVKIDVEKNESDLGDNYDRASNTFSFCSFVELFSSSDSNKTDAIKFDKHNFEVKLNFTDTFEVKDVNLTKIYVGSDTTTTAVLGYVKACACDGTASGECNEDETTISGNANDDTVSVCISSESDEMEIDSLERFVMNGNNEERIIVEGGEKKDNALSSVTTYRDDPWKGIVASTIVPTKFFSYSGEVELVLTGVVFLKLAGSGRRVAVVLAPDVQQESSRGEAEVLDIDVPGGTFRRALQQSADNTEEESAFAVSIGLKKAELELDNAVEGNGAVSTLVSGSGIVIAAAAAMGSAGIMMMW